MQKLTLLFLPVFLCLLACNSTVQNDDKVAAASATPTALAGQSGVKDEVSNPNIVQVAVQSKDHTTLVAALKAAGLVDAMSNAGPFTVFAPTNDAFNKLPAGTVDNLLKPDQKDALSNILEYHVYVGVIKTESMRDGQTLGQVNGKNITLNVKDGKYQVNGKANIIASIPTSNGIIHVIDDVLIPE